MYKGLANGLDMWAEHLLEVLCRIMMLARCYDCNMYYTAA